MFSLSPSALLPLLLSFELLSEPFMLSVLSVLFALSALFELPASAESEPAESELPELLLLLLLFPEFDGKVICPSKF